MRALAFVAAAGLACSLWAGAVAAPVTIAFTGTLIQAPTLDPADPFGGAIDTGTAFAGRYTFDAAAPDGAADAQTGSYHSVGAPYGLSVEFGGPGVFGVSFDEIGIGIGNDFSGADFYTFVAPVVAPALGLSASLVMMDSDGSVFDSDALPLGAPTLGAFESAQFSLSGSLLNADGSTTQIELLGSVETLACSAGCGVPEPGSLLLAAAGLAALRVQRRARPGTVSANTVSDNDGCGISMNSGLASGNNLLQNNGGLCLTTAGYMGNTLISNAVGGGFNLGQNLCATLGGMALCP